MSAGLSKNKLEIRDVKDRTAEQDPEYQKVVKEVRITSAKRQRTRAIAQVQHHKRTIQNQ